MSRPVFTAEMPADTLVVGVTEPADGIISEPSVSVGCGLTGKVPGKDAPGEKVGTKLVDGPGLKEGTDVSLVGTVDIPDGIVAVLSF